MNNRFSVRFFKRLITLMVVIIIISLTVFIIYYKCQVGNLREDMAILEASQVDSANLESLDYQTKYKDMYVKERVAFTQDLNTVYLTFDDGPSAELTGKVLDVLKKYNVKATFFVVYRDSDECKALIKRMIDEGHTIGIHTASHDYEKIYKSVHAYFSDFYKIQSYLKDEFNYEAKIFRFPGGSINAYNLAVYDRIIPEMYRRGYTFYDWNVSSGDAVINGIASGEIVNNVVSQVKKCDRSIVLMHDAADKKSTLEALPKIIEKLEKLDYKFAALDNSVKPILFASD